MSEKASTTNKNHGPIEVINESEDRVMLSGDQLTNKQLEFIASAWDKVKDMDTPVAELRTELSDSGHFNFLKQFRSNNLELRSLAETARDTLNGRNVHARKQELEDILNSVRNKEGYADKRAALSEHLGFRNVYNMTNNEIDSFLSDATDELSKIEELRSTKNEKNYSNASEIVHSDKNTLPDMSGLEPGSDVIVRRSDGSVEKDGWFISSQKPQWDEKRGRWSVYVRKYTHEGKGSEPSRWITKFISVDELRDWQSSLPTSQPVKDIRDTSTVNVTPSGEPSEHRDNSHDTQDHVDQPVEAGVVPGETSEIQPKPVLSRLDKILNRKDYLLGKLKRIDGRIMAKEKRIALLEAKLEVAKSKKAFGRKILRLESKIGEHKFWLADLKASYEEITDRINSRDEKLNRVLVREAAAELLKDRLNQITKEMRQERSRQRKEYGHIESEELLKIYKEKHMAALEAYRAFIDSNGKVDQFNPVAEITEEELQLKDEAQKDMEEKARIASQKEAEYREVQKKADDISIELDEKTKEKNRADEELAIATSRFKDLFKQRTGETSSVNTRLRRSLALAALLSQSISNLVQSSRSTK